MYEEGGSSLKRALTYKVKRVRMSKPYEDPLSRKEIIAKVSCIFYPDKKHFSVR